jgi:O-antigen/teichoic acid export membrane protein
VTEPEIEPEVEAGDHPDGRVVWSALSVLTTGVLGWATLVVVARGAGPADFAAYAVIWAVFFGIGGAFAGLQQEVTRTVTEADRSDDDLVPTVLLGPVLVLTVPLVVLAVLVVRSHGGALGATATELAVALGVGLVGLGVLTFVAGGLAARDAWQALALLMTGDAALRTATVVACVQADRLDLLPWAIAVGAFAWVPLLALPVVRRALAAQGKDTVRGMLGRAVAAMGATGCAALLVAGFPLLVSVARNAELGATVGVLLATLILVRAPLLVVLYGFRPVVLRGFLTPGVRVRSAVWRWWVILGGLGVLGVLLAALAGPSVVRIVFGDGYSTSPAELAVLAAGSVLLAMLVVSGIGLVAADRHAASVAGWAVAVVVSLLVLAVPDSARTAILLACTAGPAAGVAVHAMLLATSGRRA